MARDDKQRLLAANAAFYAAFRAGDMDAMDALWSSREDVGVCHPGARAIEGRARVMRSWASVMGEGEPPENCPLDPVVILSRGAAMVICEEELSYARMIATNVFVREDGDWRLVQHRATRLPLAAGGEAGPEAPRRKRVRGRNPRRY